MQLSDEERKRRSELAKSMHKRGKFGGVQKGSGRPRKQRAQEIVAEKIREEADAIFASLKQALKSDAPSVKLKAALAMLDIETKEQELKIKEETRQFENLGKEKMLELISERIKSLKEQGIDLTALDIIEGSAIEVESKQIESGE